MISPFSESAVGFKQVAKLVIESLEQGDVDTAQRNADKEERVKLFSIFHFSFFPPYSNFFFLLT
jgi:hypothetical protein